MLALGMIIGALLPALDDGSPAPDVVEMKKGRKQEGRVVYEDDQKVVLRVGSREKEIDKEDVASVRAARDELPKALDEIAALKEGDLAAHHALVLSLEERNLPFEARLVDRLVLSFAPDDELANTRLGHRKRRKAWTIPHSGRWYKFEDRIQLLGDWGDAWEFGSTHYRVRTNLPLRQAVEITLDLERTYHAFYGVFGRDLELWDITEPMSVEVHASGSSFPEFVGGGRSYFSLKDNRLFVNAGGGLKMWTLVHEATHGLVQFSAVNTRSGRGSVPGWLNEGLAMYMQSISNSTRGALAFTPGKTQQDLFQKHSEASKPYRLNRVLNFQSGDFHGTSSQDLKYAQAYSLVHLCLHGNDGVYRKGFLEFVRGVYDGQASSTHFKKKIGVREKELEAAWAEYARMLGSD